MFVLRTGYNLEPVSMGRTTTELAAGDGQNTDPQSMDYPNEKSQWTTLKWTTPKNTISDYILTLHDLHDLQPPF